jgi:hypothetical protein
LHSNYFLASRTKNLSQAQIDCSRKSVEGNEEVREAERKRNTRKNEKKITIDYRFPKQEVRKH